MRFLKKIDELLVRSFIPPFITAFFIAIFVLVMQFLWSFIDDIIGKGVSTIDLVELIFYRSLSLFPLALPIGILLSSVMVFGNLSEKYELSSLKSAGVSLLRIMKPVIGIGVVVALFSIYCSDTLIPLTNLKFQSRLWDIRNQKPALSLEEGIFNDDFNGYTIRIGRKHSDNRHLEDVLLYDQTSSTRRKFSMVTAKRGEMFVADNGKDFVMKLYDGHQYQEVEGSSVRGDHAFSRTQFDEWTKYFDMSEFELNRTDEELFKSHHSMKSVKQLSFEIDTFQRQFDRTRDRGLYDFNEILTNREQIRTEKEASRQTNKDTLRVTATPLDAPPEVRRSLITGTSNVEPNPKKLRPQTTFTSVLLNVLDTVPPDSDWQSVYAAIPDRTRSQYIERALNKARSLRDNYHRVQTSLDMIELNRIKHVFELHFKFSIACICIIFLFIGAPMGAIVRKGGYGYPLLIAIIFFTLFIIMNLMFKKLAETSAVDPVTAAWAPCIIMLPISAFLTYKAMNDSKMLNIDKYLKPLRILLNRNMHASQV